MINKVYWDVIISPKQSLFSLDLGKIWRYKDLLLLFVKRDFVSVYKQTILGPLWFFIQPILTTVTFTIIFGNIAKIPTDGLPKVLFYLTGVTMWNYFADCINNTSKIFVINQNLFNKVYFPRVIVPFSVILTNLLKFGVQLLLYICIWGYYFFAPNSIISPNIALLLFPFLVVLMAILGLGLGMLISSLTTKYRDLSFLIVFGVQLMMYATPVVYPFSVIPTKYQSLVMLNPMTSIIEAFKYGFTGYGNLSINGLLYSTILTIVIFFFGLLIFNKVEKSFIDTV